MSTISETSDAQLLDLLRNSGPLNVTQIAHANKVTATAVRQRLNRLMSQGLIEREISRQERGRPSHQYRITEKARRQTGNNFGDLAKILWEELRAVQNVEVRRGLIKRLASAMAAMYAGQVQGAALADRMESLCRLLDDRGVRFEVQRSGVLPILRAVECPYPELAEHDRGICAVEKMVLSEVLNHNVRLSQCRFDGHACCQFETN